MLSDHGVQLIHCLSSLQQNVQSSWPCSQSCLCSYAMSREFLRAGDAVDICGRHSDSVHAAVRALQAEAPQSQVRVI